MCDASYPWLILVPARDGLRHLHDLDDDELALVAAEIARASEALEAIYQPQRINVAAFGNVVEQLHIHVIVRFKTDLAWPNPVWGMAPARVYNPDGLNEIVTHLRQALDLAASRMPVRVTDGVIASGSILSSMTAGLSDVSARSNAGAKSSVRVTVSPWAP